MNKLLDWIVTGVIGALVIIAEYRALFDGAFEPFALASGIALILMVRVIHQHAPRFIAAKYKNKP